MNRNQVIAWIIIIVICVTAFSALAIGSAHQKDSTPNCLKYVC